jgi:hypothetical protein
VRQVLQARLSAVRQCYLEALEVDPSLSGRIVVEAGPSRVQVVEDTMNNLMLATCIEDRLGSPPLPVGDGTARFPLIFRP